MKKNYTKYSEKSNNKHVVSEELEKTVLKAGGEVMRVNQEEKEDIQTEPTIETKVKGHVSGCARIYVRSQPSVDSEPVCVINESDEVEIDLTKSTLEFYSVHTATGAEGYCMTDLITVD